MAQLMNAEQRMAVLEDYNPSDHLIPVGKDKNNNNKLVLYYPAAWRLYELNLRYEDANFASEIVYMDHEKDFVIVKARLFLGIDYESSPKKAEAFKQGRLSSLDKVETGAKARAARDFGIGTEYALDMVPDETDAQHNAPNQQNRTTNQVNKPNSNKNQVDNVSDIPTETKIKEMAAIAYPDMTFIQLFNKIYVSIPPIISLDRELTPMECQQIYAKIIKRYNEVKSKNQTA